MESPNDDGYWEYILKEKYGKNWKQYHKTFTMESLEELANKYLDNGSEGDENMIEVLYFINWLKEQK